MGEQAPSAGNLAQLDATVFFLVFNLKLGKKRRTLPGVMERIEASAGALTGSLDTSSIASRAPFNEDESSASSSFIVLPLFNRQCISRMVCGSAFNAIDFNRSK